MQRGSLAENYAIQTIQQKIVAQVFQREFVEAKLIVDVATVLSIKYFYVCLGGSQCDAPRVYSMHGERANSNG